MNRKIGVGVLWNLVGLFLTRGANTVFMLILAQFLAPEAFGLVAMAAVVFELGNAFVNSGLGQALIRSKTVSDLDLNTVFYSNLLLSAVAYSVLFAGAPFVADFYSQPELTALVQMMGLVVLINAAKIVQTAVFSREMDFKSQMKANALGAAISGVLAVVAAWYGWGVWSLAVQMLSAATVSALVLWLISHWRPSFQFSGESFGRLFRFGRHLLAEGLLDIAYQNSYVLVVGRFFSAEATGLYFIAKKFNDLLSQQLTNAIQQSTFPALSTLQDDNGHLRHKYRQIMQVSVFIIAPVMAIIAGLATPLFRLLFDESWQGASFYLQLFCAVGVLYPLHALNINLLNVKGRSDLVLRVGVLKKSINAALLIASIPFGVVGIIMSQIIGSLLALVPNAYYSAHLVGYPLLAQLIDVSKPIFAASVAGMVAWLVSGSISHELLSVLCGGLAGTLAYLVMSGFIRAEGFVLLFRKAKKVFGGRRRNDD
ncbi:lipopolysaccharide biosynthesis protein [Guyparkeria hydrothermalis]|uniref:lipopolysaccharide biosynthesis protein n=1 Tax=Guyparkeria hydrothermalis TaxID=923 RepID=UPI00202095C3|nr:lipopolysaccharide biosynthesis protein [Guyparkeria hydrothermalis]MCL7743683.1 lipopolysaccharide biosynthesis protein [Guyparkeria hydrothermalis]